MKAMEVGLITSFEEGIEQTAAKIKRLGLNNIQYLFLFNDDRSPSAIAKINQFFPEAGIPITGVFCTYRGMDYSTIQKGIETGGLVPIETRQERLEETKR